MEQKVAVISGCSSGFGLLTAIEMAKAGFTVVATMRNLERRGALDEAAKQAGVPLDVRKLDVTDTASLPGFVDGVVKDYSRVDVLVNNAGFSISGFIEDLEVDEVRKVFDTNFFGHVAMTKAVLPVMRRQKSGHVIMVSSIAGLIGQPVVSSYCASKHALEGWSEALRLEVAPLGIKVVLVEPGAYETNIWEKNAQIGRRVASPDSPNKERSLKFRERVRKDIVKRDPHEVARLIVRIAQDPNPKLRYLIGKDAKMAIRLKRLLPWKTWENMLAHRLGL